MGVDRRVMGVDLKVSLLSKEWLSGAFQALRAFECEGSLATRTRPAMITKRCRVSAGGKQESQASLLCKDRGLFLRHAGVVPFLIFSHQEESAQKNDLNDSGIRWGFWIGSSLTGETERVSRA